MNIDRLIESFLKFPGIGPRQAKRFVYFLAGEDKDYVDNLAKLISEVKSGMKQCGSCFRYFESKMLKLIYVRFVPVPAEILP